MEIDKVFNNDVDGVADNLFSAVKNSVSEIKAMQQRKAAENVQLVIRALKKLETELRETNEDVANQLALRIASIKDGRDGKDGKNGKDGRDGKTGLNGKDGNKGDKGLDGRDGVDGVDGISVVNANIDFDGSLIISLSDGREINVGEVVAPDLAERIKVISTMSTNGAIAVKEEGTTLTSGVKSLNFVGAGVTATTSGDDVTVTVAGGGGSGTVTSVAATVPTFLSVTGSPVTTSGTLAISLSGTALPVANGGTGITAFGTGVATALGVNTGASGAFVVNDGALGTPSSGTVTNLTGTASININGTVGATTASTGAFTTLSATGVTTVQAGTAALPAITTTGDTNTGIFFPAADTIAFAEGGVESVRIDNSGNMAIGGVSSFDISPAGTGQYPQLATWTTTNNVNQAWGYYGGANTSASNIVFIKSRSSTIGTNTAVVSGDQTGTIIFRGADGTNYKNVANIQTSVDATVSTGIVPGRLTISTTDTGGTLTERMRITSAGEVGIGTTSPSASAILDAQSTTKGVRMPNMTTAQKNAISSPAAGLMVFDTTLAKLCVYSGAAWQTITSV